MGDFGYSASLTQCGVIEVLHAETNSRQRLGILLEVNPTRGILPAQVACKRLLEERVWCGSIHLLKTRHEISQGDCWYAPAKKHMHSNMLPRNRNRQ